MDKSPIKNKTLWKLTSFLSRFFDIGVILEINVGGVERGVVVEEVGHERQVQLVNSLRHVLRRDERPAAQLVGLNLEIQEILLYHNFKLL